MATLPADASSVTPERAERRFFLIMALVMATTIVTGFSLNLAMGRSTFAVPPVFHIHAGVFFSWVALYVAQNGLIASNNVALHRRLGMVAFALVPVMVVMGTTLMIVSLRRSGGPFFFAQNHFLVSNVLQLLMFAGLVFAALRQRRYTGWHRRLVFVAMAALTGPGLGRLLPMPLLIPYAWHVVVAISMIFPLIGMIADKRRHGHVHPAWLWGVAAVLGTQVLADAVASTQWSVDVTRSILAGTPGEERPMEAFLPASFASAGGVAAG